MNTNELIASYSRHPVGFVPMDDATTSSRQENAVCGDSLEVFLKIAPDRTIEAFSYQGDPAMHTLAAASLLAEYIVGASIDEVMTRWYAQMEAWWFSVSTRRQRSAVTALVATRNAIHAWSHDGKVESYEDLLW